MVAVFRITYSGTDVDFDPIGSNYSKPGDINRIINDAQDGTLYMYTFHTKKSWRIPTGWMGKTDADNIILWWTNGYTVTFTPDRINAIGTTHSCKIISKLNPLPQQYDSYWETYFRGNIVLREI